MSSFATFSKYLSCVASLCLLFNGISADGLNNQSHPAANEIITVNELYTIVWSPGTPGNVTIVLMANSNWKAQTIASSIENTGTYTWIPEASLASDNSGSNYFLQICQSDNATECTYTYNGRFGFTDSQASSSSVISTAGPSATSSSPSSYVQTVSTSSPTTSSVSSPTSISTSAATGAAASSSTGNPSGGLSTKTEIAIGVPIAVVVTAAIVFGSFMMLRRRKRSRASPIYGKPTNEGLSEEAELYDSSLSPSELANTTRVPLHELANTTRAPLHELDTPQQGHTGQP